MYRQLRVMGNIYHTNKKKFKEHLNALNIYWVGTMNFYKWESSNVTVIAEFKRDEEKDITIEALFKVEGADPDFTKVIQWIENNLSPIPEVVESDSEELKLWKRIHEPNYEYLKITKAPDSYIAYVKRKYEEKLTEKLGGNK